MKPLCKSISTLSIGATLLVTAAFWNPRPLAASQDADITRFTAHLLEQAQYDHHRLDDKLAGRFLDRYLDSLDGAHLLFTQEDVAEFERSAPSLANATLNDGDASLARQIFDRYEERLTQRAECRSSLLTTEKFDFTGHDSFATDRKSVARPADPSAARELWRAQLRAEYLQEKLAGKKPEDILKTLDHRSQELVKTVKKMSPDAVLEIYLNALAHVYDPHSDYLGHEQLESFNIAMNLSLCGIGASLQTEDGYCKIRELIAGGPAARGGELKPGDRIVAVAQADGKPPVDIVDMPISQSVELIRGAKGSTVQLTIIPAGADQSVRRTISFVRDEIKLEDQQAKARIVEFATTAGQIRRLGVIDLPAFYSSGKRREGGGGASATEDVTKLVRKLKEEKVTGMILDLRRNGGGSLEEAINLTGLFIPRGPVVQTRDPAGKVEVDVDNESALLYDGPLLVLTSRMSASASEILAGALQDYGRALIIGDSSTFGKGTVQTILPLAKIFDRNGVEHGPDPGALKVTINKFYRPGGSSTQLKGVKADIVLPSLTDTPEIGEAELQNPLPWDTIPSASFSGENRVAPYLHALRDKSTKRVAESAAFADLQKDLSQVEKNREKKSVSLNEAERQEEKSSVEARQAARKEEYSKDQPATATAYEITVKNAEQPGLPPPVSKKAATPASADKPGDGDASLLTFTDDLDLHEAENVLADYVAMLANDATSPIVQR